ncbi:MAG TPA: helix-turn-helix transcriptional regulator [Thermoanaerobaculia bacterium]
MTRPNFSVGETLRRLRAERAFSLATVAERAGISVATLSRVETNKQSLEVGLLVTLAGILGVSAAEILGGEQENVDSLSRRLAALPAAERAQVLLKSARPRSGSELGSALDGLVSTVEVLRDELLSVQHALRRRRKS